MTDSNAKLHPDHELDPDLVAFAIERLMRSRAPRATPVPLDSQWQLPMALPEEGMGPQAALAHIADLALDGAAQLYHPGYFAHMDPPTATVTSLAALWQASANQNLLHPDAAPAARALEQRVIEWLAPCFGMSGGHLLPGSTIANFTAIWAARELRGVRRVVASERAHLSARKAADILGLAYQSVPSDASHRMSVTALGDLSDAALVVTAGTVATGAIDELEVNGAGWLHVDAAWGGPLRFSQRHGALLDGVEHADSVGFSAHKWCYQPKGTAVILFRDARSAHQAMSYGGGYLAEPNIGLLGSAPANALPFAATLLAWGRKGLAARIDAGMAKAAQLADLVVTDPRFELWGTPSTGVVVWRPTNAHAADVRARLNDAWVSLTDVDGEIWLRSVAANPSADPAHVFARVIAALQSLGSVAK